MNSKAARDRSPSSPYPIALWAPVAQVRCFSRPHRFHLGRGAFKVWFRPMALKLRARRHLNKRIFAMTEDTLDEQRPSQGDAYAVNVVRLIKPKELESHTHLA